MGPAAFGELAPADSRAATRSRHASAPKPGRDFQPSPGLLTAASFPAADGKALRIDTWVEAGCEIPPYFDPMIAKVITWAPSREAARVALDAALGNTLLYGVKPTATTCARSSALHPSPSARPGPAAWKVCAIRPTPSR